MKKIFLIIFGLFFATSAILADGIKDYDEQKKTAILLYSQNELTESYRTFSKIPEKERDAEVYLLMANIFQDTGKPIEAIYHLKKATQLDPKYYKAYYNLGNLYLEDNKLLSAVENYKKTIKLNPNFPYAYYNLGICYHNMFEYKKAKKNFVTAMTKKPNDPNFYYNLSLTYEKLNNPKKAKEAMDTYIKLKNEEL